MAISYPLSLPTVTGIAQIELRAINAVAYSQSPFTFAGQAHAYSGEMWQADISLPPMHRDKAESWISFLMSLRGQYGTFLLNDPAALSPQGTATAATITGSLGDRTVDCTVTSGDTLKAGDYIQLGSGSTSKLHKVLEDYTGTGSAADLEIWPALRSTVSSASADLTSPSGVFRLSTNEQAWSINEASFYGITFGAIEAL